MNPTEQENNDRKKLEVLARIMEKHPKLLYDISELDGIDNNDVTQKTLEEWLDEFIEKDEQE